MKYLRPIDPVGQPATLLTNEHGLAVLFDLYAVAQTALLPDELEDYLTVNIKKAVVHYYPGYCLDSVTLASDNSLLGCPVIIKGQVGTATPASTCAAWAEDETIQSVINAQIADDLKRTILTRPVKKFNVTNAVYWDSQANAFHASTYLRAKFDIDVTAEVQEVVRRTQEVFNPGDPLKAWVGVLLQAGIGSTLNQMSSANCCFFEVDYDIVLRKKTRLLTS
jgi:hypothetical protein